MMQPPCDSELLHDAGAENRHGALGLWSRRIFGSRGSVGMWGVMSGPVLSGGSKKEPWSLAPVWCLDVPLAPTWPSAN